uniref:Uncharacterized protein n=1 Tax=Anopheles albimanus TaxID=7167 RepID=A0A182FYX8_ANOAL
MARRKAVTAVLMSVVPCAVSVCELCDPAAKALVMLGRAVLCFDGCSE